jgi:hypothetical protein
LNYEWESGEWRVESGEWRVESGECSDWDDEARDDEARDDEARDDEARDDGTWGLFELEVGFDCVV